MHTDYFLGVEEVLGLCNELWKSTTITRLSLGGLKKGRSKRCNKNKEMRDIK